MGNDDYKIQRKNAAFLGRSPPAAMTSHGPLKPFRRQNPHSPHRYTSAARRRPGRSGPARPRTNPSVWRPKVLARRAALRAGTALALRRGAPGGADAFVVPGSWRLEAPETLARRTGADSRLSESGSSLGTSHHRNHRRPPSRASGGGVGPQEPFRVPPRDSSSSRLPIILPFTILSSPAIIPSAIIAVLPQGRREGASGLRAATQRRPTTGPRRPLGDLEGDLLLFISGRRDSLFPSFRQARICGREPAGGAPSGASRGVSRVPQL